MAEDDEWNLMECASVLCVDARMFRLRPEYEDFVVCQSSVLVFFFSKAKLSLFHMHLNKIITSQSPNPRYQH